MSFLSLNPMPAAARCAALLLAGLLLPTGAAAQDHDHAALEAEGGAPHFTLRGFSNVDFGAPWGASDEAPGNGDSAFALGQFDLYMISRLSTNISFLGETVFELDQNQESGVDVERLQIRYNYSDRFHAALGRGHTPLGFWNEVDRLSLAEDEGHSLSDGRELRLHAGELDRRGGGRGEHEP